MTSWLIFWILRRKRSGGHQRFSSFDGTADQRGIPEWHPAPNLWLRLARKAVRYCTEQGYPIEKLAIQFAVSNPRIPTTLFSSANPQSILKNVSYVEEPIDWELVRKVQEIIGDQMRVSWANS